MSIEVFAERVAKDLTWRVQELERIEDGINGAEGKGQIALARAGIVLLYAHWEGHIKYNAEEYLSSAAESVETIEELRKEFALVLLQPWINKVRSKLSRENELSLWRDICELQEIFLGLGSVKQQKPRNLTRAMVDVKSALDSKRFKEICKQIGIDWNAWRWANSQKNADDDYALITKLYVDRCKVAHGQDFSVDSEVFRQMRDDILELMRLFRECLESQFVNRSYLGSP